MAALSFFTFFTLIIFLHSATVSAQSPAAAPAPSATNVTAILEKAGQFTTLIKLLKSTRMADQINTQLGSSNQGITLFAPTDNAFSSLKSGTLNSISEQQKLQLMQFHVLPNFFSVSQFQTVSNPLHTQAGNSNDGQFPLNVTTAGNQVNITTGVVNATVANTIFTDNQLAVYQWTRVIGHRQYPGCICCNGAETPWNDSSIRGGSSNSCSSFLVMLRC
ncbi:fasciclin-like arabinogalactan protein 11 [Prunus yedoensis var. nudiflora]|uniref:Fasciclin-like arabinogalactan protein 11 n=1 Tax=Prunus yedoensis var. nudiflora TaxID=2094558 RepID=A0A315B3Z9_PRUYE|nr:fasciclin-like arabinogalactan protein 11 [Prunus yedoensis var. nudiflora]